MNQILIFGGYVKVSESLCNQFNIWVNTIVNDIDTRIIFPRYGSSCMVYKFEWNQKRNYRPIPIPYWFKKMRNTHHRYLNGIWRKEEIRPTLVETIDLIIVHYHCSMMHTSLSPHLLCSILMCTGRLVQVIVYTRGLLLFAFNFHVTDTYEMYKVGVQQAGEYKVTFILRSL